ncbi:putative quinol monooxygenase [Kitasatospora sp. NPDC088134]|uniref:putative quinol monooxygenase n=1 Tax=Kitasatospora sp. NPDC088134 TaxID=3364071 RepID=UPI0037F914AE
MTNGFGPMVSFEFRDDEAAAAFDDLVEQTLAGTRALEPGTLAYVVHAVRDEPNVRVFYELYADPDVFDRHEQYLSGVDVTFLSATAGKGPVTA